MTARPILPHTRAVLALLATLTPLLALAAAPLSPTSYDIFNGHGQASGGSFNYWDLAYSGSGSTNVDNAALSGGLGDLSDGVVSTQNWFAVENSAGTGPYVGWRNGVLPGSVPMTFHFAGLVDIDSVRIHADDSGGAGGVALPSTVSFTWAGGGSASFAVVDPDAGSGPSWLDFSGLGITATPWIGIALGYGNEWVFVDEVSFIGTPVPEPGSWLLMAGGLAAVVRLRRR